MIKNEHQYRITKRREANFVRALEKLKIERQESDIDPLLLFAERDALESVLADLRTQISEYEKRIMNS